jgi:hypothetical protein
VASAPLVAGLIRSPTIFRRPSSRRGVLVSGMRHCRLGIDQSRGTRRNIIEGAGR